MLDNTADGAELQKETRSDRRSCGSAERLEGIDLSAKGPIHKYAGIILRTVSPVFHEQTKTEGVGVGVAHLVQRAAQKGNHLVSRRVNG
eukprot:s11232_g1.t1